MSSEDEKLVGKPVYLALVIRDPVAFGSAQNLIGQTFAGMEITQVSTHPSYLVDQLSAEEGK